MFIIVSVLIVGSCDPFMFFDPYTGISIENNTGEQIRIELTTIYDTQTYKIETYSNGEKLGYVKGWGPLRVLIGPCVLKPGDDFDLIFTMDTDLLKVLKLGTIKSMDDVISAIDYIFTNLSVYTFDNGTWTLLYDKDYFLDAKNIDLNSFRYCARININR